MRKSALILPAIVLFALVHEGCHAGTALLYGEYREFQIKPYGLEVVYKTPVSARQGPHWALISGASNIITLALGYSLFAMRRRIASAVNHLWRDIGYWLMVLFLVLDPFNLAIGPFIYGGDLGGISVGLGINRFLLQAVALGILLLNRELVVQKVFPLFDVKTAHPLFQPLITLGKRRCSGGA